MSNGGGKEMVGLIYRSQFRVLEVRVYVLSSISQEGRYHTELEGKEKKVYHKYLISMCMHASFN